MWANALALSTFPQAGRGTGDRRVRRAHYGRSEPVGFKAGTAPTSTAKSRIGTVPHTVPGTNAGAVSHSL